MSCECEKLPCSCEFGPTPECPPETPLTKCDLYRKGMKNLWWEHGPGPDDQNTYGICLLDTMSEAQVIYSLQHDEQARQDLLSITTDSILLELARSVPALPVVETNDAEQAFVNRPNDITSIPFYAIFRGQPPFSQ